MVAGQIVMLNLLEQIRNLFDDISPFMHLSVFSPRGGGRYRGN